MPRQSYTDEDKAQLDQIFLDELNRPASWGPYGGGHYWLEQHQPQTTADWDEMRRMISGSTEGKLIDQPGNENLVLPGAVNPLKSLASDAAAGGHGSLFLEGGVFGPDANFKDTIWEGRGYGPQGNQGTSNAAGVMNDIADEIGYDVPAPGGEYFQQGVNPTLFEDSGMAIDNNAIAQLIGPDADKLTSGTKKDHYYDEQLEQQQKATGDAYFEQQKQATIDQINKDRAAALKAHQEAIAAGYNSAGEMEAALAAQAAGAGAGAAGAGAGAAGAGEVAPSGDSFHTPAFDMSGLPTVGPEPVPQPTDTSNQYLTQQGLNDWWEGLDKSGFGGNQSGGMDDFMKFMMLMSVMGGGCGMGGYGGSQYGYGGLHPGGVMQSTDPLTQLQSMGTWFKDNFGSGGTTTGNLNVPG